MKFTSLKLLLPAAFLASILTFTLGYSLVLFNGMKTTLQDQAYDTAALLSKEAALRIQGQLDTENLKLQSFIQNQSSAGIGSLGAASRAAVTQSARISGLSELAVITATGEVSYSTLPANLDGALRSQIDYIANQARKSSSAVLASLPDGQGLLLAQSLSANGGNAGIVVTPITLAQSEAGSGNFNFALIDKDGRAPGKQNLDNGIALAQRVVLNGHSTANISDQEGQSHIAAFSPLSGLADGWDIAAITPSTSLTQPLSVLLKDTIWSLIAGGMIAIGLGWIFGRWIARPLSELTEATHALISHQDFTIGHQSRQDEVGQLARGLELFAQEQQVADSARHEMLFKGKAFNTTSTAMMICEADGTLNYINDAAVNLFRTNLNDFRSHFPDFNPETLIGSNISMFHKNHARNMAVLAQSDRKPTEADISIGGQVFALGINPVEAEDGSRAGYVAVWENVRDKRRNSAILGAVNRTQVILEAGLDGRIISLNEVGQTYYGYAAQEIVGKSMGILFKRGDEAAMEALNRVINLGSLTEEHHRVTRSGEDRYVVCNLIAIEDSNGKVQRVVGICSDHTAAIVERKRAEAAEKERVKAQAYVVDGLRQAMTALANGDLASRINTPFPAEYEALRENCNLAFDSLSETLVNVSSVATAILGSASEISASAEDLSRRTENQAATLEETAAALDNLTSNVRAATDGTLKADRKVTSAHDEAQSNGAVVKQAIIAMDAIEASSHKISQIITLIDDIAFQTNLLALNAGVEAARAGDAGRGFAVVAAEVRALAQRSSEAAKEIKTLIVESETQVSTGTQLVGNSGNAVAAIVADMAEINKIVQEIALASQDQSNGLAEINAGVAMLDKVTQQNAAMVEESTAASAYLRQEASKLADILKGFNLNQHRQGSRKAS